MKKAYLFLLFSGFFLQAQTFEWLATPAITFSMNPEMIGYPTAVDAQGNTYVCGYKDTPYAYTDIFGNLWFQKYDADGQLLFSKTISGTVNAYSIHIDNTGNVLLVVAYVNVIAIDNFSVTTNLQGVKPMLLKFDGAGNLLWHKSITGNFVEHFKAVTTDSLQNIYIAYDNYGDSYVEKLDSQGNSLQMIVQNGAKSVSSVALDTENNIYVAGSCAENTANFNGTMATNGFPYNTFVVKYNSSGQMQWVRFVDDITCIEPKVVARTPDEVYFCSYLFGDFPFGTITTEGPVGGAFNDFFLAKLNTNGDYQWVKEVPGAGQVDLANRNYLTLDGNGNIYIAGKTIDAIQWTPSITTQSTSNNFDILLLKYTPDGTLEWAKTASGSAYDRTDGIVVAADGTLRITGMLNGSAVFDAIQHTSPASQYYPFVAKLNSNNLSLPTPASASFSVWPNPVKTNLNVIAPGYRGEAVLYTVIGQKLQTFVITADQSELLLPNLTSGTYFLNFPGNTTVKLVKN